MISEQRSATVFPATDIIGTSVKKNMYYYRITLFTESVIIFNMQQKN